MRAFICLLTVLILAVSLQAQGLERHTAGGSAMTSDVYVQRFHISVQGGASPGNYTLRNDSGVGQSFNVPAAGTIYERTFTYNGTPQGLIYDSVASNSSGKGVFRSVGRKRSWAVIEHGWPPPTTAPPQKTLVDDFYIYIYPPGTNLDEVDPRESAVFSASLTNYGSASEELRLMVDGQEVDRLTLAPGESIDNYRKEIKGFDAGSSGEYEWQRKNESGGWSPVVGGGYSVGAGGDGSSLNLDMIPLNNQPPLPPLPAPAPTPTPAPLPELPSPTPKPSPTPRPPGAPNTPVPTRGGLGPNGEMTEENIYEAVKAALENFGDNIPLWGELTSLEDDTEGDTESLKEQFEKLPDKFNEFGESVAGAASSMVDFINGFRSALSSVPTSFGKTSTINLGRLGVSSVFQTPNITIDFNAWYAPHIRAICLWVLTLSFFVKIVKSLNYH